MMINNSYSPRDIEFLSESNLLEGLPEIKYKKNLPPEGYLGAFLIAKSEASKKTPLSAKRVEFWHSMMQNANNDNDSESNDQTISSIVDNINKRLDTLKTKHESSDIVTAIAESLHEFEKTQPFKKDNGRVARLVANYIAKFCRVPSLVFKNSEKELYASSIKEENASGFVKLLKNKIREAVYDPMGNECTLIEELEIQPLMLALQQIKPLLRNGTV